MRTVLIIMLAFTAFTAIPSGVFLMLKPNYAFGMPLDLLQNTPFHNFFIPGLVLSIVVGGSNLIGFYKVFKKQQSWFFWSLISGIMICGWIIVQIILIHEFFWLQWLYLLIGFFTLLVTLQLKHKELI